jgi:hypothetical protein
MRLDGQLHASAALCPGKRLGTHNTAGWVGPRARLLRRGKPRTHRVKIPGSSSP